jgi:N-acyl-D-amino-acid deacylase
MSALLLANGLLVDGSGVPAAPGSVLVQGGHIKATGRFPPPADVPVLDCEGLVIAPGFIDGHSHSDLQALEGWPEKSRQGVTTEVVGNCGFSAYPAADDRSALHAFANGIFCGGHDWGWRGAADYLAAARTGRSKVNVVSLAGHGSLRIARVGPRVGPLSASELDALARDLEAALEEGATGFSTGLMYAPGSSAPFEELERLCAVVARHGAVYTTHIRSYFGALVEAVEEQLELARRTGCRLQISHLQAAGARNWPLQQRALESIERAREQGVDVAFDCYPYRAGSTVLTQILPQWALDGGLDALLARLASSAERRRIAAETEANLAWNWGDIFISAVASKANQRAVGRNLAELAKDRGVAAVEVVLDLLREEQGRVNMLSFNQSEDNLRQTLSHPLSTVVSDGFYVKGRPHPRLHGTFPLLLGTVCRQWRWLRLEEAVRKITSAPAERFGLAGRGRLVPGFYADITVFDAEEVDSPATYDNPEAPPRGIRYVFRDGRLEWPATLANLPSVSDGPSARSNSEPGGAC